MESQYWEKAALLAKDLTERVGLEYNTDMRYDGIVFRFFVYPCASKSKLPALFAEWANKERLDGDLELLAEDWAKRAKELYR